MDFIAIEVPAARVTLPREAPELLDALPAIVDAGEILQVIENELIQTFAQ